jgi:hypothetical protein
MKKETKRILEKIYYGILIICGVGLLLAVIGLTFKITQLYYTGLVLALPLFIVVLPVCLLLMALFPIGCLYGLIVWIKKKVRKTPNS